MMKYYTLETFQKVETAPGQFEHVAGPALVLGFDVDEQNSILTAYVNGKTAKKAIAEDFGGNTFKIKARSITARNGAAGLNKFLTEIYETGFMQSFLTTIIKTTVYGVRHGQEI